MKPFKAHLRMALYKAVKALTLLTSSLPVSRSLDYCSNVFRRSASAYWSLSALMQDIITGRIIRNPKIPEFRYRWVHVREERKVPVKRSITDRTD